MTENNNENFETELLKLLRSTGISAKISAVEDTIKKNEVAFKEKLKDKPDAPRGLAILCLESLNEGNWEDALAYALTAHILEPKNPDHLVFAGNVCFQKEAFHEAHEYFTQAHEINPQNHLAAAALGVSFMENFHDFEKALPLLKTAYNLSRKFDNNHPNKYYDATRLGKCYARLGSFEKALPYYEEAIPLAPEGNSFTQRQYAWALLNLGKWTEGFNALIKVSQVAPNDASPLLEQATNLLTKINPDEKRRVLSHAFHQAFSRGGAAAAEVINAALSTENKGVSSPQPI